MSWDYRDATDDNGQVYRVAVDHEARKVVCERYDGGEWVPDPVAFGEMAADHLKAKRVTESEAMAAAHG